MFSPMDKQVFYDAINEAMSHDKYNAKRDKANQPWEGNPNIAKNIPDSYFMSQAY